MLPAQSNVSLDTSDLDEPLPKPPQLSLEFQYCIGSIGHESENVYEELADSGKYANQINYSNDKSVEDGAELV